MQALIVSIIQKLIISLSGYIFNAIMEAIEKAKRKATSGKIEEAFDLSKDPETRLKGNKLSEETFASFS